MMQEADIGITRSAMEGDAGDEKLMVKFFLQPRQNSEKSLEAGRPIFEEKEYIQIITPGNKDNIIIRPVTQMDLNRFPEHYRKYKARADDAELLEGTPLEQWPAVTRSQVEELRHINVRTVEQLVDIADSNAQGIMGISMLRSRAKSYLEAAATQAAADEIRTLREQNEAMMADMERLKTAMEVNAENAPKKRGRPKKSEED